MTDGQTLPVVDPETPTCDRLAEVRTTIEVTWMREDIEKVMGAVGLAVDQWVFTHHADLDRCTDIGRVALIAQATVTYAIAVGLVTAGTDRAFERDLPVDLPEPVAGDMEAKLGEFVARKAALDAEARRRLS